MKQFKPYTGIQILSALGKDLLSKPQRDLAIFYPNPKLFTPITETKNLWLEKYQWSEGQSFDDFLDYTSPTNLESILYILPFGEFKESAPNLDDIRDYCEQYFELESKLHRNIPLVEVSGYETSNQTLLDQTDNYFIFDIATIIKNEMDVECPYAYGVIGMTMKGLAPESQFDCFYDTLNPPFRIGLVSFKNYSEELKKKNPNEYESLINKIGCSLVTHEAMHTLGLKHCPYFHCNMNAAFSLDSILRRPLHICPICLRKLTRVFPTIDLVKRYENLLNFYQSRKYFKEEAEWTEKMLENIEKNSTISLDLVREMYKELEQKE